MKQWFAVFALALPMVILSSPATPQAASTAAAAAKAVKSSTTLPKPAPTAKADATGAIPQRGGIFKVMIKSRSNVFGYPPLIAGSGKDFAPPFFDHLLSIGTDGKYKPELALSWDTSKDGKAITFKLRKGVQFHDGTPFNAQAVKANLDNLIPPKATILEGITSVEVVDDYTVKLNLPSFNNLILHHFATNPATWMYSPEALKKKSPDWATTHPVGTGPFILKDHQPNISLTLVKNPNYWQKGLPYLDGIEMTMVPDPMTQMLTIKAGQANAIYDALATAAQLRDEGYPVQMAPGGFVGINFDVKNSPMFAKRQVREAIEYAIDKEAICNGPGQGVYLPLYQLVSNDSPDYNPACPPRKYNPAKAKKLLAEAGYPNGFQFKVFVLDTAWKDGFVAAQSYLAQVGIKMDINYVNISAFNLIRSGGKIEPGAAAHHNSPTSSNTLYMLDSFWRSNASIYPYMVRPIGIDRLIDQGKLSRNPAEIAKINRQVLKLFHDDATLVPIWQTLRIAVVDKSVQDSGWLIYGDGDNNQFGTRTWLKK